MMSAPWFSSKMLKRLQKRGENCPHTFLTKVGAFQNSGSSKVWKNKLCSFCKPPAWWKTTQTSLLTKVGDFQSVETSNFKNLKKDKLCSFCKLPTWWKTNQTHLLTKVEAFESFEVSKTWKSKLCSYCNLPAVVKD